MFSSIRKKGIYVLLNLIQREQVAPDWKVERTRSVSKRGRQIVKAFSYEIFKIRQFR